MPITLRKQLGGAWESIRAFLKDDLDQIEMELNLPVDLTGATGTIPPAALPVLPAGTLLGRGSADGPGAPEAITLGDGLSMTGTVLSATGGSGSAGAGASAAGRQSAPERPRQGPPGAIGMMGPMGPPGRPGRDGARGPMGPPGINTSTGSSFDHNTLYWTLLTNGDTIEPELIFDGSGDVIWVGPLA